MSFTSTYNNLSVRGYQAPSNTYIGRLATGNNAAGQGIGSSLSLSADGNTLLVGAESSNKVLVFTKISNIWGITANINRPTSNVSNFGWAIDVNSSGNTAIIGAPSFANTSPGFAYIYANVSNTWTLQTTLSPNVVSNTDLIGYSVAINDNGDKVAAGTPGANAAANVYAKVFTFSKSGNTWPQTAILGNVAEDLFGFSINMDSTGNYLVVGAPGDDTLNQNSGKVYVYDNLSLQQSFTSNINPTPGINYSFGQQVNINAAGNRIFAAPGIANVEIWDRIGNTWTFTTSLAKTTFPITIDTTGNAAVLGNLVYIENSPNSWTVPLILQPTDITSTEASVAMEYPGYIFAGYPSEDSPATDIGAVGVWQLT